MHQNKKRKLKIKYLRNVFSFSSTCHIKVHFFKNILNLKVKLSRLKKKLILTMNDFVSSF